jgi:cytochrome c553
MMEGCYLSSSPPEGRPGPGPEPEEPPTEPPTEPPAVDAIRSHPISGGTLLVTSADLAIISDPDHAAILFTDLTTREIGLIEVGADDEPGRAVEDGAGRVHVVLRGGGGILAIDPESREVISRREVCSAPRGIDWERASNLLHVACAGGELVSLPANGGAALRSVYLDDDLRDVVVADGVIYVSRFRSAELLTVSADGEILRRAQPEGLSVEGVRIPGLIAFAPNVAWRIRAMPTGGVAMLHQRAMTTPINVDMDGYAGLESCPSGTVAPAVTIFDGDTVRGRGIISAPSMLVDFAVDRERNFYMVRGGNLDPAPMVGALGGMITVHASLLDEECIFAEDTGDFSTDPVTAVALTRSGVPTTWRPATGELVTGSRRIEVLDSPTVPRGHELFHQVTMVGLACASCHPEGAEDGHTWDFSPVGPRRTQSLLGGLSGHEPFHWNGDQEDMTDIMRVTFGERMQGRFSDADVVDIEEWLDDQPVAPGVVVDAAGVARGRVIFERSDVGCATCHSGADLTNDRNEDVGTGRDFQVPSLRGVMHRAPFFHDGCAESLEQVVAGACGTLDSHGRTSSLDSIERLDLVAYLRSL